MASSTHGPSVHRVSRVSNCRRWDSQACRRVSAGRKLRRSASVNSRCAPSQLDSGSADSLPPDIRSEASSTHTSQIDVCVEPVSPEASGHFGCVSVTPMRLCFPHKSQRNVSVRSFMARSYTGLGKRKLGLGAHRLCVGAKAPHNFHQVLAAAPHLLTGLAEKALGHCSPDSRRDLLGLVHDSYEPTDFAVEKKNRALCAKRFGHRRVVTLPVHGAALSAGFPNPISASKSASRASASAMSRSSSLASSSARSRRSASAASASASARSCAALSEAT